MTLLRLRVLRIVLRLRREHLRSRQGFPAALGELCCAVGMDVFIAIPSPIVKRVHAMSKPITIIIELREPSLIVSRLSVSGVISVSPELIELVEDGLIHDACCEQR